MKERTGLTLQSRSACLSIGDVKDQSKINTWCLGEAHLIACRIT